MRMMRGNDAGLVVKTWDGLQTGTTGTEQNKIPATSVCKKTIEGALLPDDE